MQRFGKIGKLLEQSSDLFRYQRRNTKLLIHLGLNVLRSQTRCCGKYVGEERYLLSSKLLKDNMTTQGIKR